MMYKNMNRWKFIVDFLHDALANKMYEKSCRLHLMLMYVDNLDISTVNFVVLQGPPPPHKFFVSPWTYDDVKAVLAADRISDTRYDKLQLMAKHVIDYSMYGGSENFSKWLDVHSTPSCSIEIIEQSCFHDPFAFEFLCARDPIEHLVGQFTSGMSNMLGKLVEGWTTLAGSDGDVVARQFTSLVGECTRRPTVFHGRYDYNNS
ncbi:hypothetical protein ZWY2020_028556 [Hordeum vulgare]|nr:hypothetical protein ZWY2020_028556 [Hordeum vulgare]